MERGQYPTVAQVRAQHKALAAIPHQQPAEIERQGTE
jgi:hypothetical protein